MVAMLSAAVPALRSVLVLISKSPARSVHLLPRTRPESVEGLVLLAQLRSSLF
jgi:hypothetical protein